MIATISKHACLWLSLTAACAASADASWDLYEHRIKTHDLGGGAAIWHVVHGGNSAVQNAASDPSFFMAPEGVALCTLEASVRVTNETDDGLFGITFGYQNHFKGYVLDWKRTAETRDGYGFRDEGLVLRTLDGSPDSRSASDYWEHEDGQANYTVLASLLGPGTGWTPNTTYTFTLEFRVYGFRVTVSRDGIPIWDVDLNDGSYTAGQLGFYTFQQSGVEFFDVARNKGPNAFFDLPEVIHTGDSVLIDGTEARDDDGEIVAYAWDLADGSTSTEASFIHTWTTPGSYYVELCVTDDGGLTRCSQRFRVIDEPTPVETLSWSTMKARFGR